MSLKQDNKRRHFQIQLNNNTFDCYLDTVSRKNLNVTVKAANKIYLSKPDHLSVDRLHNYLIENSDWIIERSDLLSTIKAKRDSYITDDYVVVFDEKVYYKDQPDIVDNLKQILVDYVEEHRGEFDEIFGKTPSIEVTKLKGKWGACSPSIQNILLNEKLVHYPLFCVNYVITHEYLHLLVPNHSERFYSMLEELMPNYRDAINYMKEN